MAGVAALGDVGGIPVVSGAVGVADIGTVVGTEGVPEAGGAAGRTGVGCSGGRRLPKVEVVRAGVLRRLEAGVGVAVGAAGCPALGALAPLGNSLSGNTSCCGVSSTSLGNWSACSRSICDVAGASSASLSGGMSFHIDGSELALICGTMLTGPPDCNGLRQHAGGAARSRSTRALVRSRRCSTARFWAATGIGPSEMVTLSCCKIVPLAYSKPAMALL